MVPLFIQEKDIDVSQIKDLTIDDIILILPESIGDQPIFLLFAIIHLQNSLHGANWYPFNQFDLTNFIYHMNYMYISTLMGCIIQQVFVGKIETRIRYMHHPSLFLSCRLVFVVKSNLC